MACLLVNTHLMSTYYGPDGMLDAGNETQALSQGPAGSAWEEQANRFSQQCPTRGHCIVQPEEGVINGLPGHWVKLTHMGHLHRICRSKQGFMWEQREQCVGTELRDTAVTGWGVFSREW